MPLVRPLDRVTARERRARDDIEMQANARPAPPRKQRGEPVNRIRIPGMLTINEADVTTPLSMLSMMPRFTLSTMPRSSALITSLFTTAS